MKNGADSHEDTLASFDRREKALLAAMDALKWERQEYILAREWRELNKLGEFA